MGSVGHNTEAMRNWSGDMNKASEDYRTYLDELYRTIDELVSSDFTGGLSSDFENAVLNQKDTLYNLANVVDDCAQCVSSTATNIDNDEAELSSNINNMSVF